ncbi:hypothetical protein Tco_0114278 [Tanacetum coccineum]
MVYGVRLGLLSFIAAERTWDELVVRVGSFPRVIGLWGKVRGELGEVLERWFGAETVGKGGFDFGGYGEGTVCG